MERLRIKDGKSCSVWFTPDILRRLDILAEAFSQSRSALINQLLDERMSDYEELVKYMEERKHE